METTREQSLIGRVVGREDDPQVWCELSALAAADDALWRRLAAGLEDDADVRTGVAEALRVVERVELPIDATRHDAAAGPSRLASVRVRRQGPRSLGWIAALALAALWLLEVPSPSRLLGVERSDPAAAHDRARGPTLRAGEPRVAGSDASSDASPADVRVVVGELPRLLVSTVPSDDGREFEFLYMRRILERVRVREVYEVNRDELGRTWRHAVQPAAFTRPESY